MQSCLFIHIYAALDDEIQIMSISGIADQSQDILVNTGMPVDIYTFRKEVIDETVPTQRFNVSREDGMEELKKDILSHYKDSNCKLTAKPRVRFEGEEGVGRGWKWSPSRVSHVRDENRSGWHWWSQKACYFLRRRGRSSNSVAWPGVKMHRVV